MKKVFAIGTIAALLSVAAIAQSGTGTWHKPGQSQTKEQQKETAQEKASGITDQIDITSGPTVSNLTRNSATLTWTTNKKAATRVDYGTDRVRPAQHAFHPGGSTEHTVQLKNLQPGQTYHYEIETRVGRDRLKGSFQTPR